MIASETSERTRWRAVPLLVASVAVVVAAVVAAETATGTHNTFPGRNGLIAYAVGSYGTGADFDLCVMAADGSRQRRLTRGPAADLYPAWTSDGTRLAFSRGTPPFPQFGTVTTLRVLNVETLRFMQPPYVTGGSWSWSPDSSRLVFDRSSPGRRTDVFVVGTDGRGAAQRIAEFAVSPDWSPDGSRIAISHGGSIYVVAPDGTNPRPVAASGGEPSWSPDGRRIAFDGASGIWIVNSDGSGLRQLTSGGQDEGSPVWSPDGTKIAFVRRDPDYITDIWVASVDGSGEQPLTRTPFPEWGPDWRAGGENKRVGLNQGCSPSTVGTAGRDVLRGGRRDDAIYGLAGNDRIYGKGGHDWLSGGPGADLIAAQDGTFDEILCGPGRDQAVADRRDRVHRDCERVARR
jgi:Tol biopolymer transport system component